MARRKKVEQPKERKSRKEIFDPKSEKPFQLSRYALEEFMDCKLCFWLGRRWGVKRPQPHPYTLNTAVDLLVKREFDFYRNLQESHPVMIEYGIDAVPFTHPELKTWRSTAPGQGMRYLHPATNLVIMGAPDDIWLVRDVNPSLIIVDTKATSSKENEIHPVEDDWWKSYRRQLDIYAYVLEKKHEETGYPVSDVGWFLLMQGVQTEEMFDNVLRFESTLVTCPLDWSWVEHSIIEAHACLMSDTPPASSDECEHCAYRTAANLQIQKLELIAEPR